MKNYLGSSLAGCHRQIASNDVGDALKMFENPCTSRQACFQLCATILSQYIDFLERDHFPKGNHFSSAINLFRVMVAVGFT